MMGGSSLCSEISQEQSPEVALLPLWVRVGTLEVSDPKCDAERRLIQKASGLSVLLPRAGHPSARHTFRKDDDEVLLDLAKRLQNAKMRNVLDHDLLKALVPNAKIDRDVDHLIEYRLQRLSFEAVADQLEPLQPIAREMSHRRNQERPFVRKVLIEGTDADAGLLGYEIRVRRRRSEAGENVSKRLDDRSNGSCGTLLFWNFSGNFHGFTDSSSFWKCEFLRPSVRAKTN